jgi:hypothetical protein
MNLRRWCFVPLLGAAAAFGSRLSFQEHVAVQELLAPGVYFVVEEPQASSHKLQAIRKVVLVEWVKCHIVCKRAVPWSGDQVSSSCMSKYWFCAAHSAACSIAWAAISRRHAAALGKTRITLVRRRSSSL